MNLSQRKTLQPNSKCLKNPNRKKQYQMSHPVELHFFVKITMMLPEVTNLQKNYSTNFIQEMSIFFFIRHLKKFYHALIMRLMLYNNIFCVSQLFINNGCQWHMHHQKKWFQNICRQIHGNFLFLVFRSVKRRSVMTL